MLFSADLGWRKYKGPVLSDEDWPFVDLILLEREERRN
jgi:hypothetical protein